LVNIGLVDVEITGLKVIDKIFLKIKQLEAGWVKKMRLKGTPEGSIRTPYICKSYTNIETIPYVWSAD